MLGSAAQRGIPVNAVPDSPAALGTLMVLKIARDGRVDIRSAPDANMTALAGVLRRAADRIEAHPEGLIEPDAPVEGLQ